MSEASDRPPDFDDDLFGRDDDEPGQHIFERAIPEVIKRVVERAVETGFEKLTEGPENIRKKAADLKLPKEAAQYLYGQIDDTKKGIYRIVAKEIRDVLEQTNLSDEIADVLTKLQFEITTQIRFVRNPAALEEGEGEQEQADQDGSSSPPDKKRSSVIPRPEVVSKVAVKAREALERKGKPE